MCSLEMALMGDSGLRACRNLPSIPASLKLPTCNIIVTKLIMRKEKCIVSNFSARSARIKRERERERERCQASVEKVVSQVRNSLV